MVAFLHGAGAEILISVTGWAGQKKPKISGVHQENPQNRGLGIGAEIQTLAVDTTTAVWVSTAEKSFWESLGGFGARWPSQTGGQRRKISEEKHYGHGKDSNLLRRSIFTTPPDLLCREPFFKRKHVCKTQGNGVGAGGFAIANHYT